MNREYRIIKVREGVWHAQYRNEPSIWNLWFPFWKNIELRATCEPSTPYLGKWCYSREEAINLCKWKEKDFRRQEQYPEIEYLGKYEDFPHFT